MINDWREQDMVVAHEVLFAKMSSTLTYTHTYPEIYMKHATRDEMSYRSKFLLQL